MQPIVLQCAICPRGTPRQCCCLSPPPPASRQPSCLLCALVCSASSHCSSSLYCSARTAMTTAATAPTPAAAAAGRGAAARPAGRQRAAPQRQQQTAPSAAAAVLSRNQLLGSRVQRSPRWSLTEWSKSCRTTRLPSCKGCSLTAAATPRTSAGAWQLSGRAGCCRLLHGGAPQLYTWAPALPNHCFVHLPSPCVRTVYSSCMQGHILGVDRPAGAVQPAGSGPRNGPGALGKFAGLLRLWQHWILGTLVHRNS